MLGGLEEIAMLCHGEHMAMSPYRIPARVAKPSQPPRSIKSVAVLCAQSAVARWHDDNPHVVRTVTLIMLDMYPAHEHAVYGDVTIFRGYLRSILGRRISCDDWGLFVSSYMGAFNSAFIRRFGSRVDVRSLLS